ncbi:MAG: hypothetical protein AAF215_05370 [Cyanobacteria bacterium P01_A01_bin.123]
MSYCISALAFDHPDATPAFDILHAESLTQAKAVLDTWLHSPPGEIALLEIWQGDYNEGFPIESVEIGCEGMVQSGDYVPYLATETDMVQTPGFVPYE